MPVFNNEKGKKTAAILSIKKYEELTVQKKFLLVPIILF